MKLKCLIVDDEPLAAELLQTYASQTPFLEVAGVYNSAVEALPLLHREKADVVFLDINMPKMNGLEFAKTLPAAVKVIFVTAYDQYAIEGFKVHALDYLLKPVNYTDFLHASNRALDWFKVVQAPDTDSVFVKSGYRIERLRYDEILYIENQRDYVKFYLAGQQEPIHSLMNIQQLSEKLPPRLFMRVHRSFIVNLDKIAVVERNCIVFGKTHVPVSDTYREPFFDFLHQKLL